MGIDDEFYIGYLPEAPKRLSRLMRSTVIVLGGCVGLVALILSSQQLPFSPYIFEYGQKTSLTGHLFMSPVPHLSVPLDSGHNTTISKDILLVGFGKAGAKSFLDGLEASNGKLPEGTRVTLQGTLIYGDGKALFQVEEADNREVAVNTADVAGASAWSVGQASRIIGEIVDPKCYFGVMKPGEGKAHRSCAIRCIAGGIPPVLHATNGNYYVLVNEASVPINEEILPFVGDLLAFEGVPFSSGDWQFLRVNQKTLGALAHRAVIRNTLLIPDGNITACNGETAKVRNTQ